MNEQIMQLLQSMSPEQQQQLMAQLQPQGDGMPQAPGMAPVPGADPEMAPPQVDPRQGLPGANNPTSRDTQRDFAGEGDIIADQQAQAEALRGTATPEGTYTQNAGFVAANPLQHIATAGNRIMGNMDAEEALAAKTQLSKDLGARDKLDADTEFQRKEDNAKKLMMAQELRNNRRGGTPMQTMSSNQGSQYSA